MDEHSLVAMDGKGEPGSHYRVLRMQCRNGVTGVSVSLSLALLIAHGMD